MTELNEPKASMEGKLRTLKDIPMTLWEEAETLEQADKELKDRLRAEAIKWVKRIERTHELLKGSITAENEEDMIEMFDSTLQDAFPLKCWIKHFFNLTEKELENV